MSFSVWRRDHTPSIAPGTRRFVSPPPNPRPHEFDFNGFRPVDFDPPRELPRRRASLEALRARLRRYNAELDPASDTFRAAVVLLAAYADGQNVDSLARRTGFGRAFVSKCARRLIDNGVWAGGRTVAEWSPEDEASGAFWNDVAVAEGKLCRRLVDGRIEWAPPGFWNKRYDFVSNADAPLSAVYHDAGETISSTHFDETDAGETAEAEAPGDAVAIESLDDAASPTASTNGNGDLTQPASDAGADTEPIERAPERRSPGREPAQLFPDAVWLG